MRVPLPESSAVEPSGFQITTSACVAVGGDDLEDPVRADAEVVVADPPDLLGRQRGARARPARRAGSRCRARATWRASSGARELPRISSRDLRRGPVGGYRHQAGNPAHPLALVGGVPAGAARSAPRSPPRAGSSATSLSPWTVAGSRRDRPGERPPHLLLHPALEHRAACAASIRRCSSSRGTSRPTISVGCRVSLAPEPVFTRTQARAGLGELERAHDAAPVVRMHGGGRRRVALGEQRVRAFGAELVVEPLQPLARAGRRAAAAGRGRPERRAGRGRCRRRRPASGPRRGSRRSPRARAAGTRRPSRPRRGPRIPTSRVGLGLVGQDRQPAIDLHRVRGDELGGDPAGELLGDGALAGRGRPEDREDVRRQRPRAARRAASSRSRPRCGRRRARRRLAVPVKLTVVFRRVRPAEDRGIGAARPLDEHLLDAADPVPVPRGRRRPGRPRSGARSARA